VDRLVWATPVVIAVDVILKLPALADSNAGNPVEKLLIAGIATAAFYGAPALAADMHGGEGTAASGSRDFPNKVSLATARFCPWTTSNTPANIATIRPSLKRRTVHAIDAASYASAKALPILGIAWFVTQFYFKVRNERRRK
jgi:hypothetical protein